MESFGFRSGFELSLGEISFSSSDSERMVMESKPTVASNPERLMLPFGRRSGSLYATTNSSSNHALAKRWRTANRSWYVPPILIGCDTFPVGG